MPESPPDATRRPGFFSALMTELRRRRVNHVAGLYLTGALAVIGFGGDILDNLGAPAGLARWLTLLVIAGFPVAVAVSWAYDLRVRREQAAEGRPYSTGLRGALIITGGIVVGMGLMVTVAFISREDRVSADGAPAAIPMMGVLPIQAEGGGEAAWLAGVLDRSVTDALAVSRGVSMRSEDVVAAYAHLPLDSLARALGTRYLVSVRVSVEKTETRLTVQVLDSAATLVGSTATLLAGTPSRSTAEELVQRIRDHVLHTVGAEVRTAHWRFGTDSDEAFNLLYEADDLIAQARAFMGEAGGARAAGSVLGEADALLLRSIALDPEWTAPRLARARLTNLRAYALMVDEAPPAAVEAALDSGIAIAGRLLARQPKEAQALAMRGLLQYRKVVYLEPEPSERARLIAAAEQDLKAGLRLDGSMATAAAELSDLYYSQGNFADASFWAKRALTLDAYQADALNVMQRQAMATFESGNDAEALRLCNEGLVRFGAPSFHGCVIEVLAFGDVPPDVTEAWRHLEKLRENPLIRDHTIAFYETHIAAVLARANRLDSAEHVLERVRRTHPAEFRDPILIGLEAAVRFRLGQGDSAASLLRAFAASGLPERELVLNRRALKPYRQALAVEPAAR